MTTIPSDQNVSFSLVAAQVDPGEWTTYGDISTAARGDSRWARAVGNEAATSTDFPNPQRVLGHDGFITRPAGTTDTQQARKLLEDEGIRFFSGRADPAQRIHWDELARRAGIGTSHRGRRSGREPDQE
ncbi:MAG: MGMT family protein [Actinomycetota bacterium]|nr:MGMT family protein [Actinomycetota bacterium]